ncbi:hypothetical protein [Pseudoalteromonas luteoviolacea]|uniref:Uncharacterized protein n=1 Tax=Pseudoalteromonas luteoviolacea DSM 6061 TaxID=1365250 RepID=A0A166V5W3_9GAMM|nr:hypothetical protein [Pseudoalteromonas luteoviolacea]KZN31750.1 hypothetical protein N475_04645 [Pseudoalteromonas luteoviolacea DSM 6061]KZN54610.1 hypothetical protein N474_02465 [Pseudoalteromonas luteoviolacea CPMOR-2]MBE0389087.1 hypothetical protein [Pseudoalteromonas luteoviolacea DSM 6061]TQF70440.1 hypothetical protein FLM44_04920 [Pseudoalteromonas luteoviolacea]
MHLFETHSQRLTNGARPLATYIIFTVVLLILTVVSFPSKALVIMSGELDRHLKSYNYGTKADNKWVQPSGNYQTDFKALFEAFHQQNWPLADELAQAVNYQVIQFSDVDTDKVYYLLQEKYQLPSDKFIGGGTYVMNVGGTNAVLQAPHPKRDSFTGTQAIDAFLYTQTKLLMLAGTRRDSSHDISECTGTNYSASDVAHQTESLFQVVHEYMSDFDLETVFIQYHGFGKTTRAKLQAQCGTDNDLMLNLSESVRYATNDQEHSILHSIRRSVESEGVIKACVYGNDTRSLGGTWNVQGRHTNDSVDSCHKSADASSKRFIHLEQSYGVRKYHRKAMQRHLKTALDEYFQ